MSYYLRAHSLVGAHLDRELVSRGAHTSGSTERKQDRLKRFMDVELKRVIRNEQQNTREREITRATELVFEGIREIIRERGREGAVPEIRDMLMLCPPEVIERVRSYI